MNCNSFTMNECFQYQSLTNPMGFRLVRLQSSLDDTSAIFSDLVECNLSTATSYIALSYTWRDPVVEENSPWEFEKIFVNSRQFSVGINLFCALKALRNTKAYLWVDAICINQQDNHERSIQVALMGEIFSRASKVYAWLGPEVEISHLAMDFLSHLASSPINNELIVWIRNTTVEPQWLPTWEALMKLLNRSWFKRAWIVQEIALARDVLFICGDKRLTIAEWEKADRLLFHHWAKFISGLRHRLPLNARTFDPSRSVLDLRRRLLHGDRIPVLASLQMTRYALATDPRDHLFSKVAISNNQLAELCPPNYDIPPEEVCKVFLEAYIQRKQDLYVICLAGTKPANYAYLPSWLPTWSCTKPAYPICNFQSEIQPQWPHFDAAKGTKPEVSFSSSKGHLLCTGVEVDELDGTMGDQWGSEYLDEGIQSVASNNAYRTLDAAYKALVRTITGDTNRWGEPSKPPHDFEALFSRRCYELNFVMDEYKANPASHPPEPLRHSSSIFEVSWRSMRSLKFGGIPMRYIVERQGKSANQTTAPNQKFAQQQSLWPAFEHSAGQIMLERRLFTTLKGFLGVGSASVMAKDRIVILKGCKVPVILRQKGQYWELIGECYVDGIMYGEGVYNRIPYNGENSDWQTFDII
ncbi:heterokaryon incompatibility protein-domain-containing protein [Whalleya microplaca]|nr:heterokaryon incompatibility protein-domain-containing protein [Whalleya microplaca]